MRAFQLSRITTVAAVVSVGSLTAVSAAEVSVTITNEQGADGLFLTPFVSIFHDGTYDTFDVGFAASTGVENVAETGDGTQAVADASAAGATVGVVTSPGGFAPAPVFDPGERASLVFNIDPTSDRYFSFLSMVIPSNDLFVGNDNAVAYEIFDAMGAFSGIGPISVYSTDVWDAGTEENTNLGAAFNAAGGAATDTLNGLITQQGSLLFLDGQNTAAGTTLAIGQGRTLLATIEISQVPVPAAFPLLLFGLGGLGLVARRRQTEKK